MKVIAVKPSKIQGEVEAPPSKSYTHRAFALASLCTEETVIRNPLISRDTLATINASKMLGVTVSEKNGFYVVKGRRKFATPDNVVDVMNSGTTLRIYTALSTLVEKGYTVLTGDDSIRRRPMASLLKSLNDLGAECWSTRENGAAPIVVKGGCRIGGSTAIKGTESSQFVSALLITGLQADREIHVHVIDDLVSKPYVEATIQMTKLFGADVERKGFTEFRTWPQNLHGVDFTVPGDFSSAAFIAAAAHLTQGHVHIKNLSTHMPQADSYITQILEKYGSKPLFTDEGLLAEGGRRYGDIDISLTDSPDLLPVTAAIASVNEGLTRIKGVAHARLKESDRLATVATEIRKLGVEVEEHRDGLTIRGSSKIRGGVTVESHDDHRLFMAFTVLGLCLPEGLIVKGAESADVSYPNFLQHLMTLGAKIVQL